MLRGKLTYVVDNLLYCLKILALPSVITVGLGFFFGKTGIEDVFGLSVFFVLCVVMPLGVVVTSAFVCPPPSLKSYIDMESSH